MLEDPSIPLVTHQVAHDESPDAHWWLHWWLFAQNSTSRSACQHEQILLANDEVPTLCCRSCTKRWTFVPAGERPLYCLEDDSKYPGMLDNRDWSKSTRVTMVDDQDHGAAIAAPILIAAAKPHPDVCTAYAGYAPWALGRREDEEDILDKTKRSLTWWDEHTVIRLVVTHFNEHGARVLFTMPGRGLALVATTPEQAARQIAFARERWPEGVYEVHEVRFWRDADGRLGNPVHTLIVDTLTPSSR